MPQACEELRDEWRFYDRRVSCDDVATTYLREAGFKLTRGWDWIIPTTLEKMTDQEWRALSFLVQEWDYGGVYMQPKCEICDCKPEEWCNYCHLAGEPQEKPSDCR